MRLSEAIRLGAAMSEQCQGELMDPDGRTCALGAAALGVGYSARQLKRCDYHALGEHFPILRRLPVDTAPFEIEADFSLEDQIQSLNDIELWSREQIADWIRTIEDELEAAAEEKSAPQIKIPELAPCG